MFYIIFLPEENLALSEYYTAMLVVMQYHHV
jgi:hypothetical protein